MRNVFFTAIIGLLVAAKSFAGFPGDVIVNPPMHEFTVDAEDLIEQIKLNFVTIQEKCNVSSFQSGSTITVGIIKPAGEIPLPASSSHAIFNVQINGCVVGYGEISLSCGLPVVTSNLNSLREYTVPCN